MARVRNFIHQRLITDWHYIRRLHSMQVALFWIIMSAVAGIWSALDGAIPTWAYVSGGILMNVSLGLARITKQPGLDQ